MERRRRRRIPIINSFRYGEELNFSHPASGKPVIAYSHKTWKLDSGMPMHSESGYWRPKPDASIEVVIAQSTGLAEVLGTYSTEDKVVKLQSEVVANASKVNFVTKPNIFCFWSIPSCMFCYHVDFLFPFLSVDFGQSCQS
ncbi:UPF0678 fatty acid-binding protein-like protein [Hibiscus syriacus]|uniref:UPF0678 fatty acid-binding protein-like protein n=1 Tax=Hibiscus syriacus TaxID=106335 RepID=A0A6A3CYR7_HIBSY|nr:UPF0678 fatty acid-binding protein-like protein [Hibiscus syriacus]